MAVLSEDAAVVNVDATDALAVVLAVAADAVAAAGNKLTNTYD